MLERLTNSAITAAKQCLRKYYLRYELGITSTNESKALRMGKAVHAGLEMLAGGLQAEEAVNAAAVNYTAESDPVEAATVAMLLHGYASFYNPDPLRFSAVEEVFEVPIVNPETGAASRTFVAAGKRDALATWANGIYVVEHKTTADDISEGSDYWLLLRINTQISLYFLAAQQEGREVVGVVYDVIRKPTIRPSQVPVLDENGVKVVTDGDGRRIYKKDGTPRLSADAAQGYVLQTRLETAEEYAKRLWEDIQARPNYYYARREIPRLEDQIAEYQEELWAWTQMILSCRRTGRWLKNDGPMTCRFCEYKDICLQNIPVNETIIPAGYVRLDNKHPELEIAQ